MSVFLSSDISVTLRKFIFLILVILLAACSQGAATKIATATPAAITQADAHSEPTNTPSPTEIPPTKPAVPPTELPSSPTPPLPTATPTEEATVALQETISSQQEDVIGSWESQRGSQLIFTQSGGIRIKDSAGEEMVGVGTFHFEDEQMVLDSDVCLKFEGGFAIEFACVAAYMVYSTKAGDEVVSLRFEAIEDPYRDRRNAMTGRDWRRFEE
jgi:hypothetical protein